MVKSLGIVGCGAVTQKHYVPAILGLKEFKELHSRYIFDINTENAKEVKGMLNATILNSLEQLITLSDMIIVATPPASHYDIIKNALLTGKVIVCEKPFMSNLTEARELVDKAAAIKSKLYVAHFRRCSPQIKLARSIVQSGVLGEIKALHIFEGGRFGFETKSGYVFKDKTGGVLLDTGSHTLDTALFAADLDHREFDISVTKVERNKPEPSHEIKANFTLNLKNKGTKIEGYLYLSRLKALSNIIRIIFERGQLEFPVGISNKVKLSGPTGNVILYSQQPIKQMLEIFPLQYKMILNNEGYCFEAKNFLNLTELLDKILNFN